MFIQRLLDPSKKEIQWEGIFLTLPSRPNLALKAV